jgi:tartrate-resistant acid phosphatase type 5
MKKFLFSFCLALFLIPSSQALSQSSVIRFAAIGDFGSNNEGERKVAELLKTKKPEFIITLGDNNYPNGCWTTIDKNIGKYYHEFIGNYVGSYGDGATINRFYPSLGNHDWNAKSKCLYHGNLPYLEYFKLPGRQRYYDFVKGPVHFFALDSDNHEPDGNTMGSEQYQWFASKIKQSKAPFKVVYFHHPPYSSGEHGPNHNMQWPFAGLGVDLVIAGHEHNYERIEQNGIVFVINGIAGPPHLRGKGRRTEANSKIFYSEKNGFVLVLANERQLKLMLINSDNQLIDQRLIEK